MTRVAVVVLNWDGLELTRACVNSLLAQTHACEIHVVDNGSANAEAKALRSEFGERIRLYELPQNAGFTGGCNAALEVAIGGHAVRPCRASATATRSSAARAARSASMA